MIFRILIVSWFLSFSVLSPSFAVDIYVAPGGNDGNPGTANRPLKTLVGARDAVRRLHKSPNENVTVYIRGGIYPMIEPVVFDSRDSGVGTGKVIYQGVNGETPVFSGCAHIEKWELFDRDKGIYRASVSQSQGFRQLYVDGKQAVRARYPNAESGDLYGPFLPVAVEQTPNLIISKSDWRPIGSVKKIDNVELVVVSHWYQQYLYIDRVAPSGESVVVVPASSKGKMGKPVSFYAGSVFRAENALEFLDDFNEWYLDRDQGSLYYKPPKGRGVDSIDVSYPVAESLVVVRGKVDEPVRNIEFNDLSFECTNWTFPNGRGLNVTQFAQPVGAVREMDSDSYPGGVIRVEHASKIAFRRDLIRNAGANGLQFFDDVDNSDVEGSKIYGVAGNAIEVDAHAMRNPPAEHQSSDVAIWNNEIFLAGQSYSNGGGVLTGNVKGLILEHNWIHDMPYSGVQICNQPDGRGRDIGCGGNRIRFNRVNDCMLLHDDGGGIYTLGGAQYGSVIAENYIYNIRQARWAGNYPVDLIYLDNSTTGVLVARNVVRGGRAAERNGSFSNALFENIQSDSKVERESGPMPGFVPIR